MNVTCPNCATVYRVDPAKVPEGGVRARCSVCSAVFAVEPGGGRGAGAAGRRQAATAGSGPPSVAAAPSARSSSLSLGLQHGGSRDPGSRSTRRSPARQRPGTHDSPAPLQPRAAAPDAHAGPSRHRRRPDQPVACRPAPAPSAPRPRCRAGQRHRRQRPSRQHLRPPRLQLLAPRPVVSERPAAARSAESIPLSGPRAQGTAAGPGADLRHGRVPSGQAAGRTSRRKSQGAVRGGDQEELGGVRGTGRPGGGRSTGYFREALNEILAGGRQIF